MDREELEEYRRQHPLAAIMPVIHKLLVLPSHDSGMLVAVGDEVGRLLWVEGDAAMQRRAEGMMFVPGADWSEATVGTSAPGTALALGRGIQISGAEHYKRSVHPWSCTAVPVPRSGFRRPAGGRGHHRHRVRRGPAYPVAGGGHRGRRPGAPAGGTAAAGRGTPVRAGPAAEPGCPRRPARRPATASTATASSCSAATRHCSASTAGPWRCPPGTARSWPCSAPTRKG